jgi:Zn-finger nucleic acid-binding protein
MARMNFGRRSGVVVDVCGPHGTWFDGGELDAVLQFVRDGGLEAEVHPPQTVPAAPTTPASEASMRALTAQLVLEGLHQQQSVAHVAEAADDVLFVLFGPGRRLRRW